MRSFLRASSATVLALACLSCASRRQNPPEPGRVVGALRGFVGIGPLLDRARASTDAYAPDRAAGAARLVIDEAAGVWIEARAEDVRDVPAAAASVGIAVYEGALEAGDVAWITAPRSIEELRLLRAPSAPARYRLDVGPGVGVVRESAGRIEVLDREGLVRVVSTPAFAVDARGVRRDLALALEDGRVVVRGDLAGLEYPVAIDPGWSAASTLSSPRTQFAWAALKDGRVAVINGFAGGGVTNVVDVFDPAAKTWSTLKSTVTPHNTHAAVAFPTGKVLVVGEPQNEIYDPDIDKWTNAPTPVRRMFLQATLLASGKALFVGGTDVADPRNYLQPSLYDPATDAWSAAGTMTELREDFVLLTPTSGAASGKVLVVGGFRPTPGYLKSAELYDPASNTWSSAGSMIEARTGAAGAVLPDGRVLVAGGYAGEAKSSAEIWDPSTNTWSYTKDMSRVRAGASATLMPSGRVLVVGGDDGLGTATATTEVYDPVTKTWSAGPWLVSARSTHVAIPMSGGRVLVVGGLAGLTELASAEILGGATLGEVCAFDEDCASGRCGAPSKVCVSKADTGSDAGAGDAAPDTSMPETSSPDTAVPDTSVADSAPPPPDSGTKPSVSGEFQSCTTAAECASGFCVDGVCCDSACDGACQSCTLPWAPGKCSLEPYGTDKKNACGAAGACVGTCDGKGGCVAAGAGTQCAPATCTGPSTGTAAAYCASQGAACDSTALVAFDCAPYACEPALGACRTSCATSEQCAPGFLCDPASKICAPAPAAEDDGGCAMGAGRGDWASLGFVAVALAALGRARRRR